MIARVALSFAFAIAADAAIISADFSTDPKSTGWKTFGDASLFRWNNTNENLEVTWDSSHSNSFFYLPLKTILAKSDDFTFTFDVRLRDIRIGTTPEKTNTFEIGIGLLNSRSITNTNYFRGAGVSTKYGVRNLVEFDYFPDAGFGATFATSVVSTNNTFAYAHNFPIEMTTNDLFRITLGYTASNQLLRTSTIRNGSPIALSVSNLVLSSEPDFRLDAFGVCSYSDAIQTGPPNYWGSVLAHGTIDNVALTIPNPPLDRIALAMSNATLNVQMLSRTNWTYTLQRSIELANWNDIGPTITGNGSTLTFSDTNAIGPRAFYRVRLERP